MRIPDDLRAKMLRTSVATSPYFEACKLSAWRHFDPSHGTSAWCEIVQQLDLPGLLVLGETFDDFAPWLAYLHVIRGLRGREDSQELRDAEVRITALGDEMLRVQGLGILRVADILATQPRFVSVIRRSLPEMAMTSRVER